MIKEILGGITDEQFLQLKESNFNIKCKECGEYKNVCKFPRKRSKKNNKLYFEYRCSHCRYLKRIAKYPPSKYTKKQRYKEVHTIDGRAMLLRNRCKQRAKKYGHEFNLSKDLIIDKLKNGTCEATGIKFVFEDFNYNPYAPSIDRIDSDRGYTNDNIQVVCVIYNFCKNKFSDKQTIDFIKQAKINING